MQITEKRLRKIIRNVILENEIQVEDDINIDQDLVNGAIKVILGESSLHEDGMSKAANVVMTSMGAKMTVNLLASLVIGYAHLKGVPVESLAAGATQMASEIPNLLGITDKGIIMHMINVAYGLGGATIAYTNWKEFTKDL